MLAQFRSSNRAAGIDLPMPHLNSTTLATDPTIISIVAEFTRALAKQLTVDSLSTVLSDQGRLFIGLERKHAQPSCGGSPIECALGIAATSGHHCFPLVATYCCGSQSWPFSGVDLDRLAHHFVLSRADMTLLLVRDSGEEVYQHSQLLPFPHADRARLRKAPRPFCAHNKYDVDLIKPDGLVIPRSFTNSLAKDLTDVLPNSTAGEEPGLGGSQHSACVFTVDGHGYFGVNTPGVGSSSRCAVWNALSAALVGGHKRLAGVMVCSQDYETNNFFCCGTCLDSLGDFLSRELRDMVILYASPEGKTFEPTLYSRINPGHYK
jgi:cytidine deaminase